MSGRNISGSIYKVALIYLPNEALRIITSRSNLLMITGRYKEEIADFDYLLSVDNRNVVFYYNMTIARQQTKDISGAISDFYNLLQVQPDDQMSKL